MTAVTIILSVYCTLMYVAGFQFWMRGNSIGPGTFLAWMFSPITVPLSFLVLLIAY